MSSNYRTRMRAMSVEDTTTLATTTVRATTTTETPSADDNFFDDSFVEEDDDSDFFEDDDSFGDEFGDVDEDPKSALEESLDRGEYFSVDYYPQPYCGIVEDMETACFHQSILELWGNGGR